MKDDERLQGSENSRQQQENPMEGYDHTDRNFEQPNSDVESDKQNVSDAQSKVKGNDLLLNEGRKNDRKIDEDLDLDAE